MKPIIITILIVVFSVCLVNAQLYKWVDENGVTHYSNTAPPSIEQVETKAEIKNNSSSSNSSNDLKSVLKSYKLDALQHDIDKSNKSKSISSTKSDAMADYYEHRIKTEEEDVKQRREDLKAVERESYSDSRRHDEKIRMYKSRLKKAELDLNESKRKYRKAKYGQ